MFGAKAVSVAPIPRSNPPIITTVLMLYLIPIAIINGAVKTKLRSQHLPLQNMLSTYAVYYLYISIVLLDR